MRHTAILLVFAVLVFGCSGGSVPQSARPSPPPPSSASATVPPAYPTSAAVAQSATPIPAVPSATTVRPASTVTPLPANLAANASFETGGALPANWAFKGPATTQSIVDSVVSRSGQRSVRLQCSAPCGIWSDPILVQSGRYRAVVWVRILPDPAMPSAVPTLVGLVIRGQIPGYQDNYLPMASSSLPVTGNTNGQWIQLTTEEMPSRQNVTSVVLDIFWHHGGGPNPDQSPAGALIWIDDVSFVPVN